MAIVKMVLETDKWRYIVEEEQSAVRTLRVEDLNYPEDDSALFGWIRMWYWHYDELTNLEIFQLLEKIQNELERRKDYYYAYINISNGKFIFRETDE